MIRKRSKCHTCGKTAKENGTYLNKIIVNDERIILCNDCLKLKEEKK